MLHYARHDSVVQHNVDRHQGWRAARPLRRARARADRPRLGRARSRPGQASDHGGPLLLAGSTSSNWSSPSEPAGGGGAPRVCHSFSPRGGGSRRRRGTERPAASAPSCRGRARARRTCRSHRGRPPGGARGPASCRARCPRRRAGARPGSSARMSSMSRGSEAILMRPFSNGHSSRGPVAVDLDAVALGVAQVDRLAHEVVGGPSRGASPRRRCVRAPAPTPPGSARGWRGERAPS